MKEVDVSLENELQTSYIDYAMSIIVGRALPDARDGLKPAQRRILYAMYMLKNTHDQPTKKSARIVGEVVGKYHPHGDIAAYDTLVRMAQDFSLNYMLVEGQGNMGSIDGDPPAAQRYTEVRLRAMAEDMLKDLEKRPVRFVPNFDNEEEEPVVLPSKIPNLLINGASGIAVGVATNILPHNINEVCDAICAYIDNTDITPLELMSHLKGPDFPTGGTVFMDEALLKGYITGRGSVTIRGRSSIEHERDHDTIVITEIPYTVNKSQLVERIADLVKNKVITGISSLRDESGKEGIRITIELKRDANTEYVLNTLYAHTNLQISLPVMNVAVIGNRLLTLNIKDFIRVFVDHRVEIIRRRTEFDLNKARDRRHIVEGLAKAIESIESIVEILKSSKDTKDARGRLMEVFELSERQADSIMDMQLRRLTSLEERTIREEIASLGSEIAECERVLSDVSNIYKIVREESVEVGRLYGRARRSVIESNSDLMEIESEDLIKDEESVIIRTHLNYMKRIPASAYRAQGRGGKGVISIDMREGDYVTGVLSCMSKDYLLVITDKRKAYWLKAYSVPSGNRYSSGKAAVNLINIDADENILYVVNTRDFSGRSLVFVTRNGKIKRVGAMAFSRPRANGIKAMAEMDDDRLVGVCITDGRSELFIATLRGKGLRFKESDVRETGRLAFGVRSIRLAKGDEVIGVVAARESGSIVTITDRGFGKATPLSSYRLQRRGGKGVLNIKVSEKVGKAIKVLACQTGGSEKVLLINSEGTSIEIDVSSIRTTGRNASGVKLISLKSGTVLVDAQLLQ